MQKLQSAESFLRNQWTLSQSKNSCTLWNPSRRDPHTVLKTSGTKYPLRQHYAPELTPNPKVEYHIKKSPPAVS